MTGCLQTSGVLTVQRLCVCMCVCVCIYIHLGLCGVFSVSLWALCEWVLQCVYSLCSNSLFVSLDLVCIHVFVCICQFKFVCICVCVSVCVQMDVCFDACMLASFCIPNVCVCFHVFVCIHQYLNRLYSRQKSLCKCGCR